ncbi:excinuclease ABC subunit C [Sphingobacterium psychroaquaticum]|uniref:excinuclease ABC subunit UvrC n=1 Tax=Sphingobacterium psychroaquaticum TaxID=561061 RepID=UPI00106A1A16|nr:excinuclease ABC subunit UvrC [Sphingobacterium psychroaquaticum]QBQ42342.1 excinuclease ABC subunit C [Sphingobacterium psychroaquaticum]
MDSFNYREELKKIPHKPGVYQYFDKNDELIYIGKAKDLRNRVGSYFVNEAQLNGKTRVLVRKINRIAFTIVDTEIDAWLLENNLIKKYKPRYNVLLKDDKTYPWIVIKNEHFPRIYWTRQYVKDGSRYYGPYASLGMMHVILDMIRELFPLRTCNLNLAPENIAKGKYKVCLEYQIGNCKGPCEGFQTEVDYNQNLMDIKDILNGKISVVTSRLKEDIQQAVNELNFEGAHLLKSKLDKLSNYQSKSTVVSSSITNVDVFSIASEDNYAFVNYLKVVHGVVIQTQTLEMKKRLDETEQELLALAIPEIRGRFRSTSREIIVPFELDIESDESIKFTVPKVGEKKNLLELSLKNVAYFKKERMLQYERLNPEVKTDRVLKQMQKDLRMNVLPRHIECFDNSNIQGSYPVSAIVVFKDAKPSKKDYRHFNVKTVVGPDDFATMEEAVFRRYRRVLDEGGDLPQLIVIDGGKGQLGAAMKSLKLLGIEKQLTVIGIAKRLEELYYPGDQYPLYLDKKSETLKVIQHLRDEAHRFGITFHRNQRSRKTFVSELENIPGIGKTSVEKLLKTFKSAKKVKEASDEELRTVLNQKQLVALRAYFMEGAG